MDWVQKKCNVCGTQHEGPEGDWDGASVYCPECRKVGGVMAERWSQRDAEAVTEWVKKVADTRVAAALAGLKAALRGEAD